MVKPGEPRPPAQQPSRLPAQASPGRRRCAGTAAVIQPRTEPCPFSGLAQRRRNPWLLLGWIKRRRAEEPAAAGLGRLPVRVPAREIGSAAPRGPRSFGPRYAPTPRCAGPVRGGAAPALARPAGCGITHGKRSAFPAVPRPESGPERPEVPSEPEGSAAPQRPRTHTAWAPAAALSVNERL